jgi:histidinol-phosphate aminotransferase
MSHRPALTVRADLEDVSPYESPARPARYRLNTNESPYPPPRELVEAITRRIEDTALNRYPDHDPRALFEAVASYAGWSSDGVWMGNGSNEVLFHLFLAFGGPGRTCLTFEPTYTLHSMLPRIAGTRIRSGWRSEELTIELDEAVELVRKESPEIVVVCSPNNPTGGCEPHGTVRALLEEAPGIVVVDEAYIEFADDGDTVLPLLDDHANLVVVRTFSKAFRLAGVRIGYLLGDPLLVSQLRRVALPYHLSAVTQAVGEAAVRFADGTLEAARAIARERDRIIVELQAMGCKTFPSRANFVLFQVDDADRVWQRLLDSGVLVRNYAETPGLPNCLRVTAGRQDENDAFLDAMRETQEVA